MADLTPDEVMAKHVAEERPESYGNYEDAPIIQACRSCSYDCDDDPWYSFSVPWPCETYKVAERAKTAEAEIILPTWDNWMARFEKTYPRDIEAKRALEDFGYFRRRYFGWIATPWQEEAGFTETDDQPGSQIVWLTRHLREREARVTALEAVVREVKSWAQSGEPDDGSFNAYVEAQSEVWSIVRAVELMEGK